MGYFYVFITTLMFSLIGTCVTLAKDWVSPEIISFARFFLGVIFLLIFMLATKRKLSLRLTGFPILFGAACKCVNYLTENFAISNGYSFGSIIVWPVQCVAILLFSVFFLKEKVTKSAAAGVVLCIAGVTAISLNGQSPAQFLTGDGLISLVLFLIAGTGAACFTMAQRMLLTKMDSCNLNLSMFALGACVTAIPLPITAEFTGSFSLPALFGLMMLGLITCAAFIITAEAMKTIPVFIVTVIQSMSVILSLLWAVIFFHEPVTVWVVIGTLVFVIGMVLVNMKKKPA